MEPCKAPANNLPFVKPTSAPHSTAFKAASSKQPQPGDQLITQAELARYLELQRKTNELLRLKATILERMEAGPLVEQGPIIAFIKASTQRRMNRAYILAKCGVTKQQAAELRAGGSVVASHTLRVERRFLCNDYFNTDLLT